MGSILKVENCGSPKRGEDEWEEVAGELVRVEAGDAPEEKDASEGDLMVVGLLEGGNDEESMMNRERQILDWGLQDTGPGQRTASSQRNKGRANGPGLTLRTPQHPD